MHRVWRISWPSLDLIDLTAHFIRRSSFYPWKIQSKPFNHLASINKGILRICSSDQLQKSRVKGYTAGLFSNHFRELGSCCSVGENRDFIQVVRSAIWSHARPWWKRCLLWIYEDFEDLALTCFSLIFWPFLQHPPRTFDPNARALACWRGRRTQSLKSLRGHQLSESSLAIP